MRDRECVTQHSSSELSLLELVAQSDFVVVKSNSTRLGLGLGGTLPLGFLHFSLGFLLLLTSTSTRGSNNTSTDRYTLEAIIQYGKEREIKEQRNQGTL